MPHWLLFHKTVMPDPRILPREKRARLDALSRLVVELDGWMAARAREGGVQLQKGILALTTALLAAPRQGAPADPGVAALVEASRQIPLTTAQVSEILDGCQLDLSQRRYRDWTQLAQHAHKRVGVPLCVGLEILGLEPVKARETAKHLAVAVMLCAVATTLSHDLEEGRMYLPQQALELHGVEELDLVKGTATPGTVALCGGMVDMVRQRLAAVEGLPEALPGDGSGEFLRGLLANLARLVDGVENSGGDFARCALREDSPGMLGRLLGLLRRP